MKRLLLISILLASTLATFSQNCKCDYTIKPGQWKIDGNEMAIDALGNKIKALPGQRICLASGVHATGMYIQNLKGTPDKPIVISNTCDGKATFNASSTYQSRIIWAPNNQYLIFTGSNNPKEMYGIEVLGGGDYSQGIDFRERSTNISINHVKFIVGYSAINVKTDPICGRPETQRGLFELDGTTITYCYVSTKTGEGMYIGESHGQKAITQDVTGKTCAGMWEHLVRNTTISDNIVQNVGRDGIQLGNNVENGYIFNNTIQYFGTTKERDQGSGIQINPNSRVEVYNNKISDGSGFGIFSGGTGANSIHDNVINSVGGIVYSNGTVDGGGILTAAYAPIDTRGHWVANNTLTNIKNVGIVAFSKTYSIQNKIQMTSGPATKIGTPGATIITGLLQVGTMETYDSAGVVKRYFTTEGVRTLIK